MKTLVLVTTLCALCICLGATVSAQADQTYGTVTGHVLCGYSTLSPTIKIVNDLAPESNMTIEVNPDGTFEEILAAGNYTATIDNFNLPDESRHFQIVNQQISRIWFIGQAVTQEDKKVVSKPTPTPTPNCHWHDGHFERHCIGSGHHRYCFDIWIPGYWDCGRCDH